MTDKPTKTLPTPATEPVPVGLTAPRADPWADAPPSNAKTRISGDKLVPDLSGKAKRSKEYWYWLGVRQDCPCSFLSCGGINFPKSQEIVTADPLSKGRSTRVPVFGGLQKLNEEQMGLIIKNLPLRVLRITPGENPDGTRKGHAVRIPTPELLEQRRKNSRPLMDYIAQPNDEQAAKYMFCVLCPDQDKPTRGNHYPPSLAEIGIEWPDEMEV